MLRQAGIQVFSETQWGEVHACLQGMETVPSAAPITLAKEY